jgi:hypothetical protein
MDRQIVYPGSIPLDTDLLNTQRNIMVALGYLAQAVLGSGPIVDGLACTPTTPASLSVNIGPGSITLLGVIDQLAYGSLAADAIGPLVKMGINTTSTAFTLTAPTTSGQSINYLIEAALLEGDGDPVVLPYYNAAAPAQPYSGPGNSGATQNTQRIQRVQLQLKAGAAAATGVQATPAVDSGWVGLYVVTVNYAQTQITAANITAMPASPIIPFKLPTLAPGFSRVVNLTTSQSWTVPAGVTRLKLRVVGGGGGGGGGTSSYGGGGGGAGGYAEGCFTVTPGTAYAVTVGAGGAGSGAGATGQSGGTSSFGTLCGATGGSGGASGSGSSAGGSGGAGYGAPIIQSGGYGTDGQGNGITFPGNGGASHLGGGGRGASGGGAPANGQAAGSGGGGCYGIAGSGGTGGGGLVIVEY